MTIRLALIDNYDSFTYNFRDLLLRTHSKMDVQIFRNDVELWAIDAFDPQAIVLGPGPGGPEKSGITRSVIQNYGKTVPMLGVCLGMQCLNQFLGGTTEVASTPMHGKVSLVEHTGKGLFAKIPNPLRAARYHSLYSELGTDWELLAGCDGIPMAIAHRSYPLYGLQFHPESFLSEFGQQIMLNFYALVGLTVPVDE